jgi:hypothetical protein
MVVDRRFATRRPRSIRRLGLDFVLFVSVLVALPCLAVARLVAGRPSR